MALNLNTGPYYDDFDATKNFNRILFKPGFAVQARELTQLQSILQNQIARFGEHIFVDGSPVMGCKDVLQKYPFVKINDLDNSSVAVSNSTLANYVGDTLTGGTTGIKAVIKKVLTGDDTEVSLKKTLYLAYVEGSSSTTETMFGTGEVLTVASSDGGRNGDTFVVDANKSLERGKHFRGNSTHFSVDAGLIYFGGKFIEHATQDVLVSKFGEPITGFVGVLIKEEIIESGDDNTLLDPAGGTFNFSAPGADRYKVYTELVVRLDTDTIEDTFVSLSRIVDGKKSTSVVEDDLSIYNLIGDRLAERTYLESGHYTSKNFQVSVREHLNDLTAVNDGLLEAARGGSASHIAVGVGDGKAVVRGKTHEISAPTYLKIRKGKDFILQESITTSTVYGNYIRVNNLAGEWDISTGSQIDFGNAALDANMNTDGVLTIDTISAADTLRLKGTYLIQSGAYTTQTNGINATFSITISAAGAATVEIIEGGSGFAVNETITVPDSRLGSGGGASLTFDVATIGSSRSNTYGAVAAPGTIIGSARVRHITRESGTPGAPEAVYRLYLYSINMSGGALANIKSIYFDSATTNFNGAADVMFDNTSGTPLIFNQLQNQMLFPMPARAMKTIEVDQVNTYDNNFTFQKEFTVTFATNGTSTLSVSGTETFPYSSTPSQTQIDDEFIMVFKEAVTVDGTAYAAGQIFDLQSSHFTSTSATAIALDIGTTLNNTADAKFYVKVKQTDTTPVPLAANKSKYVKIDTSSNADGSAGPWNLGICNVYDIEGVFVGSSYDNTTTDYKELFRATTGQTDNLYTHSKLIKTGNLDTASKSILVKLSYLEPNYAASQSTYFAVDSYPADELSAASPSFYTYQIPMHTLRGKRRVDLRDAIDFRPYLDNTAADSSTVGGATVNPAIGNDIRSVSGGYQFPMPRETYSTDGEYWQGRVDRILMAEDGNITNVEGRPAPNPTAPIFNPGNMLIADLVIPPYPSLPYSIAKKEARLDLACRIDVKQNRRFTMQDIAAIEKRIGRLEYYASLNFLESATASKNIADANGLDRFKNGFFVDSFSNHDLMNVNDADLNFGINDMLHEGGPNILEHSIDLEYNSGSSANVQVTGNLITLPYTQVEYSKNNAASKPRNCVGELLFNYNGDMKVFPTSDTSSDKDVSPEPVNIRLKGSAQALVNAFDNLGTAGVTRSTITMGSASDTSQSDTSTSSSSSTFVTQEVEAETQTLRDGQSTADTVLRTTDIEYVDTTTTTIDSELTVTSRDISQFTEILGVNTNSNLSDFQEGSFTAVKDISFSEFIRQRTVFVEATRLMPNTRFYIFFDGALEGDRITGTTAAKVRQIPTAFFDGLTAAQKRRSYSAVTSAGVWTNGYVESDSTGRIVAQIRIPPNRYRVGNKLIVLSNDIKNRNGFVTSSAASEYSSFVNTTIESSRLNLSTVRPNITMGFEAANPPSRVVGSVTTDVRLNSSLNQTTSTTSNTINESLETIPGADVVEVIVQAPAAEQPPVTPDPVDPPITPIPESFPNDILEIGNDFTFDWETFQLNLGIGEIGMGAGGGDPLAQTFNITNGHGIFASSIDVFFKTKAATNGITLQIREVVNGYPGSSIVPYGSVFKTAANVNISETAGTATTFTFESPVYLGSGKEYCFVLMPQANDPGYEAWVSELGQNKLGTTERIQAEDSSVGVLFVSSNNRTWNAIQAEDVKYSLKRANFTKLGGKAVFNNEGLDYWTMKDFTTGFFTNIDAIHQFDVAIAGGGSGYAQNDVVTLNSFGNGTGATLIVTTVNSGVITGVKAGAMGTNYTANGSAVAQASTDGSGSGATFNITTNTASVVEFKNKFTTCTVDIDSGSFAVGDVVGTGSSQATIDTINNKKYNRIAHNFTDLTPANSRLDYSFYGTGSAGSSAGTIETKIGRAEEAFTPTEYAVFSRSNEITGLSGQNKSFKTEAIFTSPNNFISPVIDLSRATYQLEANVINNDSTNEGARNSGNATCKYISKIVQLNKENQSEDMRVYLDQRIPVEGSIEVYAKFRAAEDDAKFRDDLYWVQMATSSDAVSSPNKFVETIYTLPLRGSNNVGLGGTDNDLLEYIIKRVSSTSITAGGSGYTSAPTVTFSGGSAWKQATGVAQISGGAVVGIVVTDPGRGYASAPTITLAGGGGSSATATAAISTITYTRFNDFAIKVVLKSSNSSSVPAVKNLRGIALQA